MRDYETDLEILQKHTTILHKFFEDHYVRRFEYDKDDHFAFMLLCCYVF